jgi:cyclic beta-1,2-glucan synthetase
MAAPPRDARGESPESLAAAHARTRRGSRLGLRRQLSALDRRMGEVYARLARSPEAVAARPLAAEWLLDNQHVIQEALQQVAESLPWRFHRELPVLTVGPPAGRTRVYALARALVERGDGHVELDVAPRFLAAYQELAPLSMGELWALPAMLRLVVLEDLVAEAERLFADAPTERAPSTEAADGFHRADAADRFDPAGAAGGADPSRIPVYVLGLRELATQDWRTFFEEASRVEALLRADPAGVYPRMDFATRDAYRKAVERIARDGDQRGGEGEEAVAQAALDLSSGRAGDGRRGHVGWWLVDRGRAELPARLGLRASLLSSLTQRITPRSVGLYLASVAFGAAALLAGALAYASRTDATALQTAVLLLVCVVPAMTVAVAYVNWIVTHAVGPRLLPKLDTDALDGERHRTVVVVPCVMTGVEDVRQQLRELEINYLGNASPLLSYALLVDLADAAFQHLPGDAALVEAARLGLEKLNERHRRPDGGPFHLLHRERRWNGCENLWMGWERKRGKLHEFNRLLLGRGDTTFVGDGRLPEPRTFRYVITVDADTFLPPTAALRPSAGTRSSSRGSRRCR